MAFKPKTRQAGLSQVLMHREESRMMGVGSKARGVRRSEQEDDFHCPGFSLSPVCSVLLTFEAAMAALAVSFSVHCFLSTGRHPAHWQLQRDP